MGSSDPHRRRRAPGPRPSWVGRGRAADRPGEGARRRRSWLLRHGFTGVVVAEVEVVVGVVADRRRRARNRRCPWSATEVLLVSGTQAARSRWAGRRCVTTRPSSVAVAEHARPTAPERPVASRHRPLPTRRHRRRKRKRSSARWWTRRKSSSSETPPRTCPARQPASCADLANRSPTEPATAFQGAGPRDVARFRSTRAGTVGHVHLGHADQVSERHHLPLAVGRALRQGGGQGQLEDRPGPRASAATTVEPGRAGRASGGGPCRRRRWPSPVAPRGRGTVQASDPPPADGGAEPAPRSAASLGRFVDIAQRPGRPPGPPGGAGRRNAAVEVGPAVTSRPTVDSRRSHRAGGRLG